jgi:membrane protease YdiL (CAAX protease family)
MKTNLSRIIAIVEVTFIAFVAVPFPALAIYRLFPGLKTWQSNLGFIAPIFVYVMAIAVPLLLAFVRRKSPTEYGIDFRNSKYHLDVMLTCFIPVALVDTLNMKFEANSWIGAPVQIVCAIALLLVLAWLLRKKPTSGATGILGTVLFLLPGSLSSTSSLAGKGVVLFLNYAVFVGFGEEILYRGYMQSRLNEVFGRPFRFFGVSFGWGALITSVLFGLMHVGIIRWILGINYDVTWAWGLWTIFGGLVFSFVREKTGSILAPALLHGLPQAIAWVAMLFL